MKHNYKYTIIVFLLSLVISMGVMAQGPAVGSWVVSGSKFNTSDVEYGFKNYRLYFTSNGISTTELLDASIDDEHYDFAFSLGAYDTCSSEMDFYLTDTAQYINGLPVSYAAETHDYSLCSDAVMFPSPYDSTDYLLFYGTKFIHKTAYHEHKIVCEEISMINGIPTLTMNQSFFQESSMEYGRVAFSVSNNIDGDRYLYVVAGGGNTSTGLSEEYGLKKYKIDDNGISLWETILEDHEDNVFLVGEYDGYNLEIQDKNNPVDPVIAWILEPNQNHNKIFLYNENRPGKNDFFLDLSSINAGMIAGIEFSPFQGEENYMYVSTENLGLIKINWNDGTLIQTVSSDFSHTYVQTAPDGKIYAVSDDGSHFGQIGPNNSFINAAFTYPLDPSGTPTTHIDFKIFNTTSESIKYYTLPENDTPLEASYHDWLIIDAQSSQTDPTLADMTWDASDEFPDNRIMFEHGFTLSMGLTLTINDMRLEFNPLNNAKVQLQPGSKLIVNNTTFTNHHCYDDEKWEGIEVWGHSGQNQELTNGNYYHGLLDLNNSIIEHAKNGVYLGTHDYSVFNGGILFAEDTEFRNNDISVFIPEYYNYKTFSINEEVVLDNISFMRNCEFYNDENFIEDSPFKSCVKLEAVKGIKIKECIFTSGGRNGIGIDAFDAGFGVSGNCDNSFGCTPETWEYSTFTDFEKGIYTRNASATSALYSVNINHAKFINNQYGIFANNLHHITNIRNNFFEVPKNTDSKEKQVCAEAFGKGIHISESNNFHIEYNDFKPAVGVSSNDNIIGIYALNNKSVYDVIYNNKFTGLLLGNLADKVNRQTGGDDADGIVYECNQNYDNFIDFELNGTDPDFMLINTHQGTEFISARNRYSINSDPDAKHWRNMGSQNLNYYIHSAEYSTVYEPTKIELYNNGNYFTFVPSDAINQCPDNGGIHQERTVLSPSEIQELELSYSQAHIDFSAVETVFNDLKDGGSTAGTSLSIAAAQPDDTWELRSNLLGKSPHLSKQVLMEAADKTDVLPNSVLLDILAANPDELKKADLMSYLENKEAPLPDYMINILKDVSTGTTYKTALLNQMGRLKIKKMKSAHAIINSLLNEDRQDYSKIRNWLDNIGGLSADIQIAESFIMEENYTDANSFLNLIPDLYDLQGDALDLFLDDKDVLALQIDLKQNDRSLKELNSTELSQLENWASNEKGKARAFSRNVLEAYYDNNTFCDCLDRMPNKNSFDDDHAFEEKESPLSIEASPNPATHYVEFTYELSEIDKEGIIIITDINGRQVQSFNTKYTKGKQAWDTRKTPAGSYIFTLKTKYFEKSGKLIIQ